jgi:hypothetical protein
MKTNQYKAGTLKGSIQYSLQFQFQSKISINNNQIAFKSILAILTKKKIYNYDLL